MSIAQGELTSLEVKLPNGTGYPIVIGPDLFVQNDIASHFKSHIKADQICVVTNTTIANYYLEPFKQFLLNDSQGKTYHYQQIILPDGEQYKNLDSFRLVLDHLITHKQHRSVTLIALGGGVIGDLTGFAAACYQRGVSFIQVPTTLLAQVDSSVGGKTAVNHPQGKNLIGAFHQPSLVWINTSVLKSLPDREYNAGLAEVIKYGLIADADFFAFLEANIEQILQRDPLVLRNIIARSCAIKAQIISQDERDQAGIRAVLNFGHTVGHAIEALTEYKSYLHGEAVAIGMCVACGLSQALGFISGEVLVRLRRLLQQIGLPHCLASQYQANYAITTEKIITAMRLDKKNTSAQPVFILLNQLGGAALYPDIQIQLIAEAIERVSGSAKEA